MSTLRAPLDGCFCIVIPCFTKNIRELGLTQKTDACSKLKSLEIRKALREKYPNMEFFLVRISPHSD